MILRHKETHLLFIAVLAYCMAQDRLSYGFSVGPTLSLPKTSVLTDLDLVGAPVIEFSTNPGLFLQSNIEYNLSNRYHVQTGFGFVNDRFSIKDKEGLIVNEGTRVVNHIQIPVSLIINLGNSAYSIGVGSSLNVLLSAKEEGTIFVNDSLLIPLDPNDPVLIGEEFAVKYDRNLSDSYNSLNLGGFIQINGSYDLSQTIKGIAFIRLYQYFNAIENERRNSFTFNLESEKEPTILNFGFGIQI